MRGGSVLGYAAGRRATRIVHATLLCRSAAVGTCDFPVTILGESRDGDGVVTELGLDGIVEHTGPPGEDNLVCSHEAYPYRQRCSQAVLVYCYLLLSALATTCPTLERRHACVVASILLHKMQTSQQLGTWRDADVATPALQWADVVLTRNRTHASHVTTIFEPHLQRRFHYPTKRSCARRPRST